MNDFESNPAVKKVLDFALKQKQIAQAELKDNLPDAVVHDPEQMENILQYLLDHGVAISNESESDIDLEEDEEDVFEEELDDELVPGVDEEEAVDEEDDSESEPDERDSKKKLNYQDGDGSIDDPIRLYLREIGKENLLSAEQEVELSKKMEDGGNIIKRIIKNSGMIIPEFWGRTGAFKKRALRLPGRKKKAYSVLSGTSKKH